MNTRRTCTLIVALASLFALPALFAQESGAASIVGRYRQEGIASWYGTEFEGRPTASGEAFDPADLTAAHPSLPFGTLVRVTNRHNGKSVVVRVNDRGPFVAARIIDVSRGAAELLDMIVTGTAPVIVESDIPFPGINETAAGGDKASPAREETTTTHEETPAPAPVMPTADYVGPPEAAAESDNQKSDLDFKVVSGPDTDTAAEAPVETATAIEAPSVPAPAVKTAPASTAAPVAVTSPETLASLPPARVIPQLPDPKNGKFYRIQVGSYKVERFAAIAFDKLEKASFAPAYERYQDMYRVVIPMVSSDKLEWYAKQLGQLGFREVLVRQER